jgi:phospholipase/lecithinase/hemolysin
MISSITNAFRFTPLIILRRTIPVLFLLPAWAFAQGSGGLFIFGDSLSDSGNFFHQTGDTVKAPFQPIPDAPYSIGGHHFSNGATWVEQLAEILDLDPSAHPAVINPGQFTNYAFGRARARSGAPVFPLFDLSTQVNLFLSDFAGNAPTDATYIFFIGTNDARDAFAAGGDPTIVAESVSAIGANIAALFTGGARKFVVLNVPNLGITPAVSALPDPIPLFATLFTAGYNGALSATLDAVEPLVLSGGGQIIRVDIFSILNAVVADDGAAAGLSNVKDACLTFGIKGGFMCEDPDGYLFWDGGHPTRAGHAVFAAELARLLSAP